MNGSHPSLALDLDTSTFTTATTPMTMPSASVQAPVALHLGVTITTFVLVGILFVAVYVQLLMVLCLGHKLISYQTLLFFDILLWATFRLTLYSFYFYHCCELLNELSTFSEWLLVDFPSALQYLSLAVLVHFFGGGLYRSMERRQENSSLNPPYRRMKAHRWLWCSIWLSSVVLFFAGNVAFSITIMKCEKHSLLVLLRVVLLDGLFLIMGITLGVLIILIYTTKVGKDVLEIDTQGVHKCKPLVISILLILLFVSRTVYNLVALGKAQMKPYGYSTLATDMADYEFRSHYGYIVYLVVQIVWEVIPTYLIVFFFRVTSPSPSTLTAAVNVSTNPENRKHFFDNPHRYDSETEELLYGSYQRSSQVAIPNLPTRSRISPSRAGYGATSRHHYSAPSKYSINSAPYSTSYMPGTTPPQLFTRSPSFFSDH